MSQGRLAAWRDAATVPSLKNARAVAHALDLPVLNCELAHTDRLFAEVEKAVRRRESARPKPRPRLRSVTDDPDDPPQESN